MARDEHLICASDVLVNGGDGVRFTLPGTQLAGFAIRFRNRVYAYRNLCAHVPIELDWEHGKFFDISGLYLVCATHGAYYAPDTGRCLGGPCRGGRLYPLAVEERDGSIFLIDEHE